MPHNVRELRLQPEADAQSVVDYPSPWAGGASHDGTS